MLTTWEWYTRYVNYMRMIYEIYDNYIVDIWQMRHMIYELWYLRYIIPKVNLSVFLLLSQRTIKMVSNDVSVTSLLWHHGALYRAAFYQKPSLRVIPRCVLPKSVIGLYITLRFTKIEMRSLWGQYPQIKVILMLPLHEADISCHCIINEIWYDTCAVIYDIYYPKSMALRNIDTCTW